MSKGLYYEKRYCFILECISDTTDYFSLSIMNRLSDAFDHVNPEKEIKKVAIVAIDDCLSCTRQCTQFLLYLKIN